ncbi:putative immunoglobulin-blocking virulence protein [Mycoplasma sp. OR1901]|uniref:putative immunoglobulin-blocking virulence protein n=1 Tax=Mycoplasma sp. OR1901 TaxID=2742195 RepID=UPI001581F4C5|nr:putative immunoglobulin-blocking virulence protein [Mycoplasma sp. OR1901]QKT05370.1 putative immunoglobulin-blocking virulence protein [Mycoplasma sp. OR1901]
MYFVKRKKLISLLLVAATAMSSGAVATLIYNFTKNSSGEQFNYINKQKSPNLINKEELELNNKKIINSNIDLNLKEIEKKEPLVIEKPKEEVKKEKIIIKPIERPIEKPKVIEKPKPKPIEQPKPIEKPIEPPAPKPDPVPEPEPEIVPEPKPGTADTYIEVEGVRVKAKLKGVKQRQISSYDRVNKIANREEYVAVLSGELISIEVTEELRNKVINNAAAHARALREGKAATGILGYANEIASLVESGEKTATDLDWALNRNENNNWNWRNEYWTFQLLIEHGNFQEFLTEDAKIKYPQMLAEKKFVNELHRKIWIIKNLDFSKFTKMAPEGDRFLKKGMVLDPRSAYLNANGEWTSSGWSGPKQFNGVIMERERNNSQKRAFDYDTAWGRSPEEIQNGTYPGWSKVQINPDYDPNFKEFKIGNIDGLNIFSMQRDGEPKKEEGYINQGYVVEIDASKSGAYERTKTLVKQLTDKKVNVTSYRIKHMGKADAGQNFKEILSALPTDLRQLELYFDAGATNTSSLIALEDKRIKELSLYTDGNASLDSWSINPWALKETAWVNTIDYNNAGGFAKGVTVISRITFDTLAFEESDIKKEFGDDHEDKKFERINQGLRRAYWVRNNEAIFQSMGPGLNPDHNEKGNGYPMGLDFGRAPSIRTLRGLVFKDIIKPQNGSRQVQRVNFANNEENYKLKLIDLEKAGFENFIPKIPGVQEPKITFTNGNATKYLLITDNGEITSKGIQNITKFFDLAKNLDRTIRVAKGNTSTIESLKRYGYTVEEVDVDNPFVFS